MDPEAPTTALPRPPGIGGDTHDQTDDLFLFRSHMILENRMATLAAASDAKSAPIAISRIAGWLANTLNCIADGLLATNSCGEVLFMNTRAEQMTGWPLEKALRQSSSRIFHLVKSANGTPSESPLREAFVEEQVFRSSTCSLVDAEGERTPIEYSAAPIRTEHGEVVGAVVVFREHRGR